MIKMANKKNILTSFILFLALVNCSNSVKAELSGIHEPKQLNIENLTVRNDALRETKLVEKPKIIQTAKSQTTIRVTGSENGNATKINYKVFNNKEKSSDYAVVYINNKEVVRYNYSAGGFSPEARTKILVNRLQQFLSQNGNPKDIVPGKENNCSVGRAGNNILFTADKMNAEVLGLSPEGLSIYWVNNIREALNTPKIVRGNSFIASRGDVSALFATKYLGKEETGIASWYGGIFHGRKSADGSVYNKYEFTAAHKTLPFGSLVKVTNLNNSKSCIVKITDRGPFVKGRIIDLSRAAAQEIGVLSSGVSRVKLEIIGKH
jgi:rare lipoprotein A (peptidoglycan hydrolase)